MTKAWCCSQVKLCDPCLSALCVPCCKKALYKYSSFPFPVFNWYRRVTVLRPTQHKIGHFGEVSKQSFGLEKQNLTQQKHASTNEKKCIQRKRSLPPKKTKAGLSRLLRHSAGKRRWPILVSALRKFLAYLLTYVDTYPLTYCPGPTWGRWEGNRGSGRK